MQNALSPSHALIMQDFSREETIANQNKASPANSLPMFPNRETGGADSRVSFFFFYHTDYVVIARNNWIPDSISESLRLP